MHFFMTLIKNQGFYIYTQRPEDWINDPYIFLILNLILQISPNKQSMQVHMFH